MYYKISVSSTKYKSFIFNFQFIFGTIIEGNTLQKHYSFQLASVQTATTSIPLKLIKNAFALTFSFIILKFFLLLLLCTVYILKNLC